MIKLFIALIIIITSPMFANISWTILGQLDNGSIVTQIQQTLPKGWHTYWKNPGESGLGAKITPLIPDIKLGELQFPRPSIFEEPPLITYGYDGAVNYTLIAQDLPLVHNALLGYTPPDISAKFEWLECKDVCIQQSKIITLVIPKNIPAIRLPASKPCTTIIINRNSKIQFKFSELVQMAEFFPYANNQIDSRTKKLSKNSLQYKFKQPLTNQIEATLSGELYINDEPTPYIVNQRLILTQSLNSQRIIFTAFLAFLGGIILNLMPCVLPVLGLKLLHIKHSKQSPSIKQSILYAIGVIGSLWALYAILVLFKTSGVALGWGFQLQSPIMVFGLLLFFLIFLFVNWDFIPVKLPSVVSRSTNNNMIASGALTTIVATPCTAPFLGTALFIALSQSIIIGSIIFISMGIGLALPMSLLLMNPRFHQWIPSSGRWNHGLKMSFGLGFIATIIWLFWVLSQQISQQQLLVVLTGTIAIILIMSRKYLKISMTRFKAIGLISLVTICVIIGFLSKHNGASSSSMWKPFRPGLIQSLEQSKTPYFIDVTASWCVTCQTNKLLVLNTTRAIQLFSTTNTTLIRADWTNNDPKITRLLHKFNQISIPTYIYFDGTKHNVLTDVLTFNKLEGLYND